jgi:hypothetical protein
MDTKSVFTKTFAKKTEPIAHPEPVQEVQKTIAAKKSTVAKKEAVPLNFDTENIVKAIHQQKEETQRITVDMPKEIYQQMKVHLAHENVSIRDFIVRLVDVYMTKNGIKMAK